MGNSFSHTEQVFTYGTLRLPRPDMPTDNNRFYPQILPYVQAVTPAHLPGADLYDLGTYPAARPGQGVVQGDLLTVDPAALAIMDRIEGHPNFFRRARALVHTEAGPTKAWVYWAPERLIADRPCIAGGDWFQRGIKDSESSHVKSIRVTREQAKEIIMKATIHDLKVGDSVVVKTGIIDPDLGTDLGGWQGRISGIDANEKGEILISIRWDSITLKNMPGSVIEQCEQRRLDWAERVLTVEEIEWTNPRDAKEDVARTAAELAATRAWSYLGEQGKRIRQVLAGVDEYDEVAIWDAWARYLRENLTFPFEAKVCEVRGKGSLQVGDRVTVEKIFLVDDLYGVIVRLTHGGQKYDIPLCDLDVIDGDSPNYQIVDDYCIWFANR